jgi:hypothetical protein
MLFPRKLFARLFTKDFAQKSSSKLFFVAIDKMSTQKHLKPSALAVSIKASDCLPPESLYIPNPGLILGKLFLMKEDATKRKKQDWLLKHR